MEMEEILDKVEEEWIAKTIDTPPSPLEEASWSTPKMQDNAFSSEENLKLIITSKYKTVEGDSKVIYIVYLWLLFY